MDYLYDQTQYFTIQEEQESGISFMGIPDGIHCSILTKSDYDSNSELYSKIAQAIKFGTTEAHSILLLNTLTSKVLQLSDHVSETCKLLICFGIQAQQLGLAVEIVKNRVYPTETYSLLFTDSLDAMKTDTEKKKAFWNCIQTHIKK